MGNTPTTFAEWRDRINATQDQDSLAEAVEGAIGALVPKDKLNDATYSELSGLVLAFIAKKGDLEDKKARALKALEPFSVLAPAAAPEPAPEKKPKAKKKSKAETPPPAAPEPASIAGGLNKFDEAFGNALCRYFERKLDPFQIPPQGSPLPFILSAEFGFNFVKAVRNYVVPYMLENRRVRMMAQSMGEEDLREDVFMEGFAGQDKDNIARFLWLDRMGDFRMALTATQKKSSKKNEKKEKGGGFLGKLMGKKKHEAPKGPSINEKLEKDIKGFWKEIKGDGSYDPPKASDFELFEAMFDYVPSRITKSQQGLVQMLRQESGVGGEGGREGSTRQYISREINALPAYCGELVALWAYYTSSEAFTGKILKSFLAGQGTSTKERKRALPMFLRWVPDLVSQQGTGGGDDAF